MGASEIFPKYIDLGGQIVHPQPIKVEGMRLYGFLFESHPSMGERGQPPLLQMLIDQALNAHPDRRFNYHALSSHFLLTFSDSKKLSSADHIGYVSELGTTFWVITVAVRRGRIPIPERLVMYVPYIFVDNQWSIVGGREAYGFRKSLGEFHLPGDFTNLDLFTTSTLAFRTFSPEIEAKMQEIVRVSRIDEDRDDENLHRLENPRDLPATLLRAMVGDQGEAALHGLDEAVNFFDFMPDLSVPVVFIKQFRDIAVSQKACVQEIVEAPARLLDIPKVGLLSGKYLLTIDHADSHPIDLDLGVPGEGLIASVAFWSELDFIVETGTLIQGWYPRRLKQAWNPISRLVSWFK